MLSLRACVNLIRSIPSAVPGVQGPGFSKAIEYLNPTRNLSFCPLSSKLNALPSTSPLAVTSAPAGSGLLGSWTPSWTSVRTNIRIHFPRPREHKRIGVHGWKKRMSTPGGRRVLMRRILKGRHSLSH